MFFECTGTVGSRTSHINGSSIRANWLPWRFRMAAFSLTIPLSSSKTRRQVFVNRQLKLSLCRTEMDTDIFVGLFPFQNTVVPKLGSRKRRSQIRGPFLESPETFRAYSGDISLFVSSKRRRLEARKDQLYRISRS